MIEHKRKNKPWTWTDKESAFRVWAFRLYYLRLFRSEIDLDLRFAKALLASAAPIRDRQGVLDWFDAHTTTGRLVMDDAWGDDA